LKTCQIWIGNSYCGRPASLSIPVRREGGVKLMPICDEHALRAERQPTKPVIVKDVEE
jgi:hypothetical protein